MNPAFSQDSPEPLIEGTTETYLFPLDLPQEQYHDNETIGTPILLPKPATTTRLLIFNPNGFNVGPAGTLPILLNQVAEAESDICMISETNCDTNQHWIKTAIHEACQKQYGLGQFRMVAGHTPKTFTGQYKPGGVMLLTAGNVSGRVVTSGADKWGRWVHMRLSCGAGRHITFICTYQVCKGNPKTAGEATYMRQLYSCMEAERIPEPQKLRRKHSMDLVNLVKEFQGQGDLLWIGGDFNEPMGHDPNGMTRLCSECNLRDPFFEMHGHTTFKTHISGSQCIDYCLVSPELLPAIEAVGYEGFNMRILSDHRSLYIDVDTHLLFGSHTVPVPPMNAREYTSKHIHNTHKYFQHMTDHLTQHNWYNKIQQLQDCITTNTRDDTLANDLDDRRITACQWAGKHLKRYPAPPYSPELTRLRNINSLLRIAIRQKKCPDEDSSAALANLQAKLGRVGIHIPESLEDCQRFQRENLKVLRAKETEEMKDAKARRQHQEEKIKAYTDAGNNDAAKAIQRIRRAEATQAVYNQLAAARGKCHQGGLSYVKVPVDSERDPKTCNNPDDWREVRDPKEVAEAIRSRLQKHFAQAQNCNLTSPPFDITMHFDAACDRAEQILTGTYDTSELDSMTTALLEGFHAMLEGQVAVDASLTAEALLGKIKVWKERTSTSPMTGVHLGHAKAYIADTSLSKDSPEWEELQNQRAKIIQGHVVLLNYALHFGHSFPRWQSIVNAMLEKDPGNPKIHRLRVIHLYEWDFNLLLGVKWRQLLHHVCDHRLINSACYGTMPGRSSLDPVFIQEMEYEIARLTRRPLLHFDNDATSCYDRIPCFLANLASRKYGMHKKVCIVQAKTLEQAKYFLKTNLGISDEYAEHTQECPWFGTGQGSGNSPFYWLLISSSLYDLYCAKSTGGAHYSTPDKTLQITLFLLGFVDDVKQRTTLDPTIDSEGLMDVVYQLIQQATTDSQLWHDILTAANQELELTKCKYHFIHFDFDDNGAPHMVEELNPNNPQYPLTITGKDNQPVKITCVPSSKAIKYLGCLKSPANQKQQLEALQQKCDNFARIVQCGRLTKRGVRVFYQAIYRLSVNYPLPVCYFSFKQLDKVQSKAHQAIINGCGYSSKSKRHMIYGPAYLQGAAFFHLYDEQGYGQVSTFIKAWRSPQTHSGQILRVTVAWAQYAAGTGTPILQDTSTKLPHFESHWLASLRTYLHAIQGKMQLDQPYLPSLQRQQDAFIMDAVLLSGKFQPNEIRKINYCRLYLRVITLADISNANGTMITDEAYQGSPDAILRNSDWCHVHQKRPGPKSWEQWRRLCRLVSNNNHQLLQPLGPWTVSPSQIRRQWVYWQVPNSQALYQRRENGSWTTHLRMIHDFDGDVHTETNAPPPAQAVPVDAHVPAPGVIRMQPHYNQWAIPTTPAPPAPGLVPYLQSLDPWETALFKEFQLLVPEPTMLQALCQDRFIFASDGSQAGHKASFGWIVSTSTGTRLATCKGPCFGAKPNSYRAEGYGLLSVSRFLYQLHHHFALPIQSGDVVCDNKSMVNQLATIPNHLNDLYPNSTLEPEWDLIVESWTALSQIPPSHRPQIQHIKGHQDMNTPYQQLSLKAQLNCDADKLANEYIVDHPNDDYTTALLLPTSGIQLNLSTGTISSKLKQELRLARTTPPMFAHLTERFGWNQTTLDDIDWECSRRAYNRLQKHQLTLVKHANNYTPTGSRVNRYDPKYPPGCPSCPEPLEVAPHIHQCQCPARVEVKNKILSSLRKKMTELNTPPDMMELLLEGLKSVFENRGPETIHVPPTVHHIATAQQTIGWEHILRGRLTKLWSSTQQQHLGEFQPKNNGQTWATDIIQLLLQGWLDLWHQRNGDRHGRDVATKQQIAKAQAIRELELLYSFKDMVMPRHQWLFDTPLQARMSLRTYHIRAFIANWKSVIEESYKERLATG